MRLIDADDLQIAIKQWFVKDEYYTNRCHDKIPKIEVFDIIDNAPTIEYPFYKEAYQTGFEEGKNMTKEELIKEMEELKNNLLEDLAKCNAKYDVLVTQIAELNSLIGKAKER